MTTKAKVTSQQYLLAAVEAGDLESVSQFLQEGGEPDRVSGNGWTLLMLAVMHDYLSIAELLLESGADPNLATNSQENPKRSPLAVAVSNGRVEAVKLLLAYRADTAVIDANGATPLDLARKLAQRPFRQEAMQEIAAALNEHQAQNSDRGALMISAR